MKERRWLLPFTFGVDVRAIDLVIRLAKECDATIVAASLIVVPEILQEQGPRLEYIQQSKDFLEVVRWKAARYDVSVEPHEVWTADIHERIKRLVLDLHCDSIVVVTDGKEGILLDNHEVANLLMGTIPASITLIRMPAPGQSAIARLKTRARIFFNSCRDPIDRVHDLSLCLAQKVSLINHGSTPLRRIRSSSPASIRSTIK
jgi:hypothetical protein